MACASYTIESYPDPSARKRHEWGPYVEADPALYDVERTGMPGPADFGCRSGTVGESGMPSQGRCAGLDRPHCMRTATAASVSVAVAEADVTRSRFRTRPAAQSSRAGAVGPGLTRRPTPDAGPVLRVCAVSGAPLASRGIADFAKRPVDRYATVGGAW